MTQPEQPSFITDTDFVTNPLSLRCTELIELVTHYLDGALDISDHQFVEVHLAGCGDCMVFVAQIQLTAQLSAVVGQREPNESSANVAELSALIALRRDPTRNK